MSVSKKLLGGFGALLLLVLASSVTALLVTRDLSRDLKRAAEVTARKQYLAGEVNAATSGMASGEQGTVLSDMLSDKVHAEQYQKSFGANASNLRDALEELGRLTEGSPAESNVGTLKQQAASVMQAHEELAKSVAGDQMDAALQTFSQKVQPRLEEIGKGASALVEQENRELAAAAAEAAAKSSRITAGTLLLTLLGLAVGAGVFWIVRGANASLHALSARMADSATRVASTARQVSAASRSLAQGASEQAASLEETSASTEEIVSITRKNADHASEVAGLMRKTEEDSGESNRTLDRMVAQMKEIDGSSHKIARIIKVILLSLRPIPRVAKFGPLGTLPLALASIREERRTVL
jgi:methyl-accepting chemotaxis protein/methyl-accepting chemotaxis protein-1 (serine sensor receptor)